MPQPASCFAHPVRIKTNISGGTADSVRDEDQAAGTMKTMTTVVESESSEDLVPKDIR